MMLATLQDNFKDISLFSQKQEAFDWKIKYSTWSKSHFKSSSSLLQTSNIGGDDRKEIWNTLFGDTPMPSIQANSISNNFGILDNEIKHEIKFSDFESMFKHTEKKIQ